MTDVGTLPTGFSANATGINASGQVVGYAPLTSGDTHAFLYTGGSMTDLGTLGGHDSEAFGINDGGEVVGEAELFDNARNHAFLYSAGVMTDLGSLGGNPSYAVGINDIGQIAGWSWKSPYQPIACDVFLYWNGVMTDLGSFGNNESFATGINASGQIVGWFFTAGPIGQNYKHGFLYSNGRMTDLGTLGGLESYAYGINDNGQVVGWSNTASGAQHAILYSNGTMIDLNSLLPPDTNWVLRQANAINNFGQITGYGVINLVSPGYVIAQENGFLLDTLATITSMSPSSVAAGGAAFPLTVTGANFVPSTTVMWNGAALATTYVSATELTASVPASLVATPGTASVTVTTTEGTSAGATFTIHAPRGLPKEPERPRDTGQREEQ